MGFPPTELGLWDFSVWLYEILENLGLLERNTGLVLGSTAYCSLFTKKLLQPTLFSYFALKILIPTASIGISKSMNWTPPLF